MTPVLQMTQIDYNNRTYEDILREFQMLFANAMKAFQLIPVMYNRLTLVDKLSHNQTVKKIHDDHIHLQGFSPRSIRRYLPADNPAVPPRVRPTWPKKSITQPVNEQMLSINKQCKGKNRSTTNSIFLNKTKVSMIENEKPELDRMQKIEDEKQQLDEQVTTLKTLHKTDKATIKDLNNMISNGSFVTAEHVLSRATGENITFEFSIGIKEVKHYVSSITATESTENLWFNVTINKESNKVIEICLGRRTSDNIMT
jgi:hypothetical protein